MEDRESKKENTAAQRPRSSLKSRDGIVVSNKMDKTVVVAVTRLIEHALYHKYIKRTKRYFAHDQNNECAVGDTVRIIESRPLSKKKRWRVEQVLTKAV